MLCPLPGAAPVAVSSGQAGAGAGPGATLPLCHHPTLRVPRMVGVTHPNGGWDAEEPVGTPPLQAAAEQSPWGCPPRVPRVPRGTHSSVIMSPWGCFMCRATAASPSST